jgi:hypothetical protein
MLGHDARLMAANYVRPYSKGQKNDFRDAEAIAEAVQRPTMKFVATKSAEQLDLTRAGAIATASPHKGEGRSFVDSSEAFFIPWLRAGAKQRSDSLRSNSPSPTHASPPLASQNTCAARRCCACLRLPYLRAHDWWLFPDLSVKAWTLQDANLFALETTVAESARRQRNAKAQAS